MPRRSQWPLDPTNEAFAAIEHIREGTFEKFESDWTFIENTGNLDFTHGLDEIPWTVSVLVSATADGDFAVDGTSSVTVTKTDTTINVTSSHGSDAYFLVRAM